MYCKLIIRTTNNNYHHYCLVLWVPICISCCQGEGNNWIYPKSEWWSSQKWLHLTEEPGGKWWILLSRRDPPLTLPISIWILSLVPILEPSGLPGTVQALPGFLCCTEPLINRIGDATNLNPVPSISICLIAPLQTHCLAGAGNLLLILPVYEGFLKLITKGEVVLILINTIKWNSFGISPSESSRSLIGALEKGEEEERGRGGREMCVWGRYRWPTGWQAQVGRVTFYCKLPNERKKRKGPVNLMQGPRVQECC